ncbi:MAG: response regulator transcription factor [Saprospiraceae bacterium]|jgi:DNA-binding NarL/FixJ family response regulator|nr:response regulator transcription factor [Saprospiraceae bacterium]
MTRVFIIDDHPMVVEGIKALLANSETAVVCGSAHDGYSALAQLKSLPADVALVDINLPDMNGIDLCGLLKKDYPDLKILGLSTFKERSYITRMIEAGASGYLLKNATKEELEDAIATSRQGRMYMSMEVAAVLTKPAPERPALPLLTAREKEVLQLIADGLTNQEIADKLFISILTVDSHRKNLLAKFNVKNTAAMVRFALEYKLIEL